MPNFYSILNLCSAVIGLLIIIILLTKQRHDVQQKFWLVLFVVSLTYNAFLIFLLKSTYVLEYPHFYKTGSPFTYLIPISFFLYAKSVLSKTKTISSYYFLLLIVPFLHTVELIPFYLKSAAYKANHLKNIFTVNDGLVFSSEGWLTTDVHFYFQFLIGIILCAVISITLYKEIKKDFTPQLKWLSAITVFLFLFFSSCTAALLMNTQRNTIHDFGSFVLGITLLSIFINLFLSPEILYGRTFKTIPIEKPESLNQGLLLSPNDVAHHTKAIEAFYKNETHFLSPEFRLQDLANHTGIAKNVLSYVVNKAYQKNFNQLLNEKRIEVALEKLQQGEWQNLSINGIANMVGFQSRTTFNKAFKEKTGKTPSAFTKQAH